MVTLPRPLLSYTISIVEVVKIVNPLRHIISGW